jgi:hypothetical protein
MRPRRPGKFDKKHPQVIRDSMEDIKELAGEAPPVRNEIQYMGANRDRALGEADRTGRHYDETPAEDEGSEASKEHEAD